MVKRHSGCTPLDIEGVLEDGEELVGNLLVCQGVELSEHTHARVVCYPVEVGDESLLS